MKDRLFFFTNYEYIEPDQVVHLQPEPSVGCARLAG